MKVKEDYKVFKIKLQDIILNNNIKIKITEACRRTHLITTHVYQFIRSIRNLRFLLLKKVRCSLRRSENLWLICRHYSLTHLVLITY